jgi:squalene-hopene/tetraprenyl-beta-curcumene cyclase
MIATSIREQVEATHARLSRILVAELNDSGHWSGELSSSALSTAVATIALGRIDRGSHESLIRAGLEWLAANQNTDGGWGDTIRSRSNISTTALCWAAFGAANADPEFPSAVRSAESWLCNSAGSMETLPDVIARRYGRDRTFSVPILMTLALSGRLGHGGWRRVPGLPFELAILPRKLYGALRFPVVSYALPALIAIGQAIHHHAPTRNPLLRFLRNRGRARTLKLLSELQPSNGGFLEATPLTAFVTMSLAVAGNGSHVVARKGAEFLRASIRKDGSWPIDTNLATWVTTLSIRSLAQGSAQLDAPKRERLRAWLLAQQTGTIHPYTGAAPGAWAWTDLPGGVPDADDTAGALIALHRLGESDTRTIRSAEAGVTWLLNLQNRDGGIPTFCLGWGTLPFDRSTPEITAHALRAWWLWRSLMPETVSRRIDRATQRAIHFLESSQHSNGAFIPLWFGNEHAPGENNPVYGTAQVLTALNELARTEVGLPGKIREGAAAFLVAAQHESGGWGGDDGVGESMEETALAVEALSGIAGYAPNIERGTSRLLAMCDAGDWKCASPIGLYFARLWYYERLYPLIFSVSALGRILKQG